MADDRPEWRARAASLRDMAAELAVIAGHFNLEQDTCEHCTSTRYRDMVQWQLNERTLGVAERLTNIAATIERRAHEFRPKKEEQR